METTSPPAARDTSYHFSLGSVVNDGEFRRQAFAKESSGIIREKGNTLLKQCVTLPQKWRILPQAIAEFQRANKVACAERNREEQAKSCKSISVAEFTYFQLDKALNESHLVDSIRSIGLALQAGESVMQQDWTSDAENKLVFRIEEAKNLASFKGDSIQHRVTAFMPYKRALAESCATSYAMSTLCRHSIQEFKVALGLHEEGKVGDALGWLAASRQTLGEAQRAAGKLPLDPSVSQHEEQLWQHECVWLAETKFRYADGLLRSLLSEDEYVDFDKVWEVVDTLRQAIVLAREQDVELEAQACAKMGVVFESIIRTASKARELYEHSVQLAVSLHPKLFDSVPWYQDMTARLQRLRDRLFAEDERRKQEEVSKELESLMPQLEAIDKAASTSWQALIRHLYKHHPPVHYKDFKAPEEPFDAERGSKILLECIRHYHPDKVDEGLHGREHKVLCGEVVKRLNGKYGIFKEPAANQE